MGPEEPGDPYSGSRKATGASGHTGNTTSISIIKMRHLTHLISQNSKVKKLVFFFFSPCGSFLHFTILELLFCLTMSYVVFVLFCFRLITIY